MTEKINGSLGEYPAGAHRLAIPRPPMWLLIPRYLVWRVRGLFSSHITVKTPQGIFRVSTSDQGLAGYLYRHRQYEFNFSLDAVSILKREKLIPEDGGTMLDIGANIGIISVGLLRAGEIQRALAIEPEPANIELLKENVRQNGLDDRILIWPVAVGAERQVLKLEVSRNNKGDHRVYSETREAAGDDARRILHLVEVESHPLDDLLQRPDFKDFSPQEPSFIWIDVQGYETYVFRGARELLRRGIPTVSELWPDGMRYAGVEVRDFVELASSCWDHYWIRSGNTFRQYEIAKLPGLLEELARIGRFTNAIFVKTGR